MSKTETYTAENNAGCGLVGALLHKRGVFKLRKPSMRPLSSSRSSNKIADKNLLVDGANKSRKQEETATLEYLKTVKPAIKISPSISPRLSNWGNSSSSPEKERNNAANTNDHQHGNRNSGDSRNSSSSSSDKDKNRASQLVTLDYTRKLRKETTLTSSELSYIVTPHRGSSGNIMLLGHLGNLKKQADTNKSANNSPRIIDYKNETTTPSLTFGNVVTSNQQFSNLYSSMMGNLNPETLKNMGNEKYKQGRLMEALEFYNQAIMMDSSQPTYYSNKSAALMGLGHLVEAVFECKEAIRIEEVYKWGARVWRTHFVYPHPARHHRFYTIMNLTILTR